MKRIAVIFDNRPRPETTGLYCRRALGELVCSGQLAEVEHFTPDEYDAIPSQYFDLFLFVDDGLIQQIPEHLKPAAWWAIDTHLEYERALTLAQQADWTFAAQKRGALKLASDGIENASWLPLACDPEIHGKRKVDLRYDLAFVGNGFPGERERLLSLIQHRFPKTFVGNRYLDEMAEIYSASKIVFNRSLLDDLNMRVFEGLCSGALMITNSLPESSGQAELFQGQKHLVNYSNDDQLWEVMEYYLHHDAERLKIAEAGRQEVLRAHTYRHRMESMLNAISNPTEMQKELAVPGNQMNQSSVVLRSSIQTKANDYFEHDRADVLAMIPETARNILEIGCGGGRLGASIKRRQAAHVTGVEYDPVAAQRARKNLDEVLNGDIESGSIKFENNSFDCIVCADVLEHLRSPETVLALAQEWLKPDGCLVTSLPNIRNHTIIRSLLAGNWTYETAGLLDIDHVRFFTRREIEKLLYRTGFSVEEMKMVGGEGYQDWVNQGSPIELSIGGLQIRAASVDEAAEFYAYQYLTRSVSRNKWKGSKTSIIIVTHNQFQFTKQCVESILLRTDEPIELIFVDNASSDGTARYLQSIAGAKVICNESNRGFPAAANQGINLATGESILLLNNDTIVSTGWLERMLNVLYSSDQIGLVGPVSNQVSGPQQIAVNYRHVNELDGFAWDWGQVNRGKVLETERLVGFCLLIKKSVLDQIGGLDERFGVGNFEDDDLCRRAREAGYRTLIAIDSFVHHFGSVSFQGAGYNLGQILQENQKIYQQKWASPNSGSTGTVKPTEFMHTQVTLGKDRPLFTVEQTAQGLKLQPNQIRLSACLIVRDNEETIRPCLETLKPWVDEIVVVDTGSQDATPDICEELGARVFHWPWRDDFAAARNESIDHARGEWIFWMDSDDTLPEHCGRQLRELVDGPHPDEMMGYVAQVHCPGKEPSDITAVDHVKLFRNRPDLRFEFRIHEQIIPSIRRAQGEVGWTGIYVVHSGSDQSQQGRARKLTRDFRLLEKELNDRPEHPFVLFNLGMTHADAGQYELAVDYLTRCINVSGQAESHLCKAYALLVNALSQLDRRQQAWEMVKDGLKLFPDNKELLFRLALLDHQFERYQEAAHTYHRILDEETERSFTSVDQGIASFKARHNLALVYEDWNRFPEAEKQWRILTSEHQEYFPGWRGLGENLLSQNKSKELRQLLQGVQSRNDLQSLIHYFEGKLAILSEEYDQAKLHYELGLQIDQNNIPLLNEICRWHFECGNPIDSEHYLQRLISVNPDDPASFANLGVVLMQQGKYETAAHAFEESLKYRPDRPDVVHNLEYCQKHSSQKISATNGN